MHACVLLLDPSKLFDAFWKLVRENAWMLRAAQDENVMAGAYVAGGAPRVTVGSNCKLVM